MNRHFCLSTVALGLMALLNPQFASANPILTYTGIPYTSLDNFNQGDSGDYTASMFVSGTIELATALGVNFDGQVLNPIHWSFNDGRFTVSDLLLGSTFSFYFKTDGTGDIVNWSIHMSGATNGYFVDIRSFCNQIPCFDPNVGPRPGDFTMARELSSGMFDAADSRPNASSQPFIGTWSVSNTVPEPASLSLLVIGLAAGLGFVRHTRRPN